MELQSSIKVEEDKEFFNSVQSSLKPNQSFVGLAKDEWKKTDILRDYIFDMNTNSIKYSNQELSCTRWYYLLGSISLVLSILITGFQSSHIGESARATWLFAISMINTALISISSFSSIEKKIEQSHRACFDLEKLAREVNLKISKFDRNNANFSEVDLYTNEIRKRYDQISSNAPLIGACPCFRLS